MTTYALPTKPIDWKRLYEATNEVNKPTPGYLFNDIIHDVSHADPLELPSVASYLAGCVEGDHAHVKLKALFVIKSLAYRVPPFCEHMRAHFETVQRAAVFEGPPSEIFGDEPYRLVREAADSAMQVLTSGDYYHTQYREMSSRIVGFGNYQPSADTILPDGSIDTKREISLLDVAGGTVNFLRSRVSAVLGKVREMFASPFGSQVDEVLDIEYGDHSSEDRVADESCFEDCFLADDPIYECAGNYVPPALPGTEARPISQSSGDECLNEFWDGNSTTRQLHGFEPGDAISNVWQVNERAILQEHGRSYDSAEGDDRMDFVQNVRKPVSPLFGFRSDEAHSTPAFEFITSRAKVPFGGGDVFQPTREGSFSEILDIEGCRSSPVVSLAAS